MMLRDPKNDGYDTDEMTILLTIGTICFFSVGTIPDAIQDDLRNDDD